MTSKERADFKTQAMQLDSIFQIGKSSLTPQMVNAIRDALKARELIKVSVLKNCLDDPREIAEVLSERTGSEVVQVIGKKIVLYKKNYELEEKRKRAEKRKAGMMQGSAWQGKAGMMQESARQGKAKKPQNVMGKKGHASISGSAGSRSGQPVRRKQMKWSDR